MSDPTERDALAACERLREGEREACKNRLEFSIDKATNEGDQQPEHRDR